MSVRRFWAIAIVSVISLLALTACTGEDGDADFAAPNGESLSADLDASEIAELLDSALGPTTDFPGTLARFTRFPSAVPTLPDSRVLSFEISYQFDQVEGTIQATSISKVVLSTTATEREAQSALEGLVGEDSRLTVDSTDYLDGTIRLDMTYRDALGKDTTHIDSAAGWSGSAPLDESVELKGVSLAIDSGRVHFSSGYVSLARSAGEVTESIRSAFPGSDWTLVTEDELGSGPFFTARYLGEEAFAFVDDRTRVGSDLVTVQLTQSRTP